MAETLIERIWAWLHATFPERQVYIRSEGRVQFFTFGPTLQATLAGLALIFLGWVAFASVNVIFKDRIIASKDHRYQQMQWAYENRVAELQQSYDELNGALVAAEDRFKSVADQLQIKQDTVTRLLSGDRAADALVVAPNNVFRPAALRPSGDAGQSIRANDGDDLNDGMGTDRQNDSQVNVMPPSPDPQRTSRPTKASFLDNAVTRLADRLFEGSGASAAQPLPQQPAFQALAFQTGRIARMDGSETALLQNVDRRISTRIGNLQTVLRRVGLNAGGIERQASEGTGGPFIPIENAHVEGVRDGAFAAAYMGASAHERVLDTLFAALNHVPLTTPVRGGQFEITSDFGPRVDPFTGRLGFHSGIDIAGPLGSVVVATAPGTVVWAGQRSGYGNLVEIDHGNGFHTRYGHLSAILVRTGARVAEGAPVGRLGSTGRSTGPHVHYEVLLADAAKDPGKFIAAGRSILR